MSPLAKAVVDIATGHAKPEADADAGKNPHAVALGRMGGLVGGKARAAAMTPEQRNRAARNAVRARWAKRTRDA